MNSSLDNSPTGEKSQRERKEERWDNFMKQQNYWESRIFEALSLITIGVIFLLNTTGILSWSVWLNIFRYWPLFIVSAGISIIFGNSRLLKFIGSLLSYLIFLGILFLAIFNPLNVSSSLLPQRISINSNSRLQEINDVITTEEYPNVKMRELDINLPIGDIKIGDSIDSSLLSVDTDYYLDAQKPTVSKVLELENLAINVSTSNQNVWSFMSDGPKYSMLIGKPEIPTSFALQFSAGNSDVNLSDLKVSALTAKIGAGNLSVKLSEDSVPENGLNLKNGLGNITLKLPDNVGLKINYKVGLGNFSFNNKKISGGSEDSTFTTDNYSSAKKTVVINLEVGLGNIEIITY